MNDLTRIEEKLSKSEMLFSQLWEISVDGMRLTDEYDSDKKERMHDKLSDREYQIMCLIASGKSAEEIAFDLSISIITVYSYRNRILEKMHLKSNVELTQYALQNKLIEI